MAFNSNFDFGFDRPTNVFANTAKNSKKTHNGAKIAMLNSDINVQASVATEGESSTAA